jgi:MFS family permease
LWIACGLFIVSLVVMLFARHVPPVISAPHERPRDLLKNRAFWILAVYFGVGAFALRIGDLLAPNYLEDVRLLTFGMIGLLFSINALGNVATNLIAGNVSRRWSYLIVLGFMWLGLLGVWRSHSMVLLMGSFFAMGAVWTGHTISAAGVASTVPPRNRGLAFGIMDTMIATGTAIAAPISGTLYASSAAHDRPFMAALIALPIGGLLWLLVRRVLPAEPPAYVPSLALEELESPEGVVG